MKYSKGTQMKRPTKRFQEGGFTPEQEAYLGEADRTDPYILARMRRAVPNRAPIGEAAPAKTPAQVEREYSEMPTIVGRPTNMQPNFALMERERNKVAEKEAGMFEREPDVNFAPSKPKQKVVTKEQLQKSGMSLQDYLNKERGLKRRDGSAKNINLSSMGDYKIPKPAEMDLVDETGTPSKSKKNMETGDYYTPVPAKAAEKSTAKEKSKEPSAGSKINPETGEKYTPSEAKKAESKPAKQPYETPYDRRNRETREAAAKRKEEKQEAPKRGNMTVPKPNEFTGMGSMTFAKGGAVSSASKRADGIAQRGKTKCKMY